MADERHLWPAFFHLIEQCGPPVVFGEQVASKDGLGWLDLVLADLEGAGYAVGAADLCAAGVGAPHIRQRLYWVAHADERAGRQGCANVRGGLDRGNAQPRAGSGGGGGGAPGRLADSSSAGLEGRGAVRQRADQCAAGAHGVAGWMADSNSRGLAQFAGLRLQRPDVHDADGRRPVDGFWRDADWLPCRDDRWRPVSPSPQPVADGVPESLGRVRDEIVQTLEGEVNAWELESGFGRTEALRDLWRAAHEAAPRVWAPGGVPGLYEAAFLLAFLRQLAQQGWGIPECLPIPRQEVSQGRMRVLWVKVGPSCPPRRHGLDEQLTGEYPDALRVLSSVLARHTHQAWGVAHAAYAESGSPLVHGARGRVARLRGYGNAIVPQVAATFIQATGLLT